MLSLGLQKHMRAASAYVTGIITQVADARNSACKMNVSNSVPLLPWKDRPKEPLAKQRL